MKITPHFSWEEWAQPARHGFELIAYPEEWIVERLTPLCRALEVIRAEFGKSVTILSGYRSAEYNRKIGGAQFSQHVQGRAADIVIAGVDPETVYATALRLALNGKIVIGGLGRYPGFTHVDVRQPCRVPPVRWRGGRTKS